MKHRGSIYTPIYLWNELVIEIVVNKQANMFCLFSIIMLSVDVQFILTLFLPPSQQQQQQHQERVRERTRRGRHQSTIQTVNETDVACAASLPPSPLTYKKITFAPRLDPISYCSTFLNKM